MACGLTAAACFAKRIAARSDVTERGQGWYSMTCPTGRHGPPLRLHAGDRAGDRAHITYADLGKCPESETYKWLTAQGIPAGCLKKPKDWPAVERSRQFGSEDGKLADAILGEAFGDGTTTERLIRIAVLALGELPEGPMCEVLAGQRAMSDCMLVQSSACTCTPSRSCCARTCTLPRRRCLGSSDHRQPPRSPRLLFLAALFQYLTQPVSQCRTADQ